MWSMLNNRYTAGVKALEFRGGTEMKRTLATGLADLSSVVFPAVALLSTATAWDYGKCLATYALVVLCLVVPVVGYFFAPTSTATRGGKEVKEDVGGQQRVSIVPPDSGLPRSPEEGSPAAGVRDPSGVLSDKKVKNHDSGVRK